ncbi:MAG: GntR family transcriptional regulator, partial [Clostridia bacterium]|nr:GntR family transcriptional regulator [Clostridia bacterium]
MEFHIDDQKPIYKQIVEQVLIQIKSGELAPGARLPTERELVP